MATSCGIDGIGAIERAFRWGAGHPKEAFMRLRMTVSAAISDSADRFSGIFSSLETDEVPGSALGGEGVEAVEAAGGSMLILK